MTDHTIHGNHDRLALNPPEMRPVYGDLMTARAALSRPHATKGEAG